MEESQEYFNSYVYGDISYIFGIPAHDLYGKDAISNLFTTDDLKIVYDGGKNKYCLEIETIYQFQTEEDEINYYSQLLSRFAEWMAQNQYDIHSKIEAYQIFNPDMEFDSIPEVYAWFKLMCHVHKTQELRRKI